MKEKRNLFQDGIVNDELLMKFYYVHCDVPTTSLTIQT